MIRIHGPIVPNEVFVACSGGVDSMAALSFFANKSYRKVTAAFFDHGTESSKDALEFLKEYLPRRFPSIGLIVGRLDRERAASESPEEFWRNQRYKFLHSLDGPVVTAHHLDDSVETWVFTSLHGRPHVIPYRNRNVIRPLLLTPKTKLIEWCSRHNVEHVYDKSNSDTRFMRNRIRHKLLPEAYKINPGLRKVVARKIADERGV